MKALYIFFILIISSLLPAAAGNSNLPGEAYPATLIRINKNQPKEEKKYHYGIDELLKAQANYRAVEEASAFNAIADSYAADAFNKSAVDNYKKALSRLKNYRYSSQYADLSFKLASVYYRQKKYDNAAYHLANAIACYDTLGMKANAGKSYIKMASVKMIQKNYKDAEYLILKKGLPLCAPADNLKCYQILAATYQDLKRFSESKWFFLQANTLSRKLQDTTGIITSLTGLGKVKTAIKDYTLAAKDLKEAERLAANKKYAAYRDQIQAALAVIQAKSPKTIISKPVTESKQVAETPVSTVSSTADLSVSSAPEKQSL